MNDTVVAAVDKVVGKKMCGRPERATELGLSRQHDPSFLTHRRSEIWSSPTSFAPERFLEANAPRPERYFPYGGGRRRCLGAAFAQFEMRIVLAGMLHRCSLRAVPGDAPRGLFRGITIAPSNGVPVIVESRR